MDLNDFTERNRARYAQFFQDETRETKTQLMFCASWTNRRAIRRMIRRYCTLFNIALNMQEDKSLLWTDFAIGVRGEYRRVQELIKKIEKLGVEFKNA